jgi:hypothetical protein
MPCLGLFTQHDFEAEVADLPITIEARSARSVGRPAR